MSESSMPAAPGGQDHFQRGESAQKNPGQGEGGQGGEGADHGGESSIKETIESILVAFILAFIFRAFVVEAFVIPTGSMAPTLLGANMRFVCPDCGYQFEVNYSPPGQSDAEDLQIPSEGTPAADVYCPNCGYHVSGRGDAVPVRFGDRILVLKYIYLVHEPRRWDVVVFKSPDKPDAFHYTMNFIKRLVGKPGERLMVLDGDIYVSTAGDPTWRIQTKPPAVQEALWRLVYDNDFYPQHVVREGQRDWVQPWRPQSGSGWSLGTDASNRRTFRFDNLEGAGQIAFDPNANSTTQTLTNYLVYDIGAELRRPGAVGSVDDERACPVSDLKLALYYRRTSGDGPLRLKLSRHESVDHTFTAEIGPQTVRLLHRTNGGEQQIGPTVKLADLGIAPAKAVLVELQNVDYQVTLRLDGQEVLQSTPADYAPNVAWLLQQWRERRHGRPGEAEIEAQRQSCTLEHVGLWRDVYYTNRRPDNGEPFTWASPTSPVVLGDDEYFVMGDNSDVSADARYWDRDITLPQEGLDVKSGRVPEQFLLGQAVFVYWPAGFRAFDSRFSIIPDFGDMRWIH
ncbi:MAG: S26 family signal peptidase [Tepidisphaeraceae bacterium]|jgi:signal peptidase I